MKRVLPLLSGVLILANSSFLFASNDSETIFVSAKAPISADEFSGSVSVITAEEIKATGATNIAEALEGVAGVSIGISGGNAGEEIRIRGMDAEYGLILIDGRRIPNTERNLPFSPASRNRWVAMEDIERIEIIRGAASSLYGADALSGVINIITKKATKEWRSSVTLSGRGFKHSGGDGGGINISTRGALSEKVGMKFSVDQQQDSMIKDDAGLSIRSKRQVTNTQVGLVIDIDAHSSLDLGFIYGEESAIDTDAGSVHSSGISELVQNKALFSAGYSTRIVGFNSKFSVSGAKTSVVQGSSDWKVNENNFNLDIDGGIGESQYLSAGLGYRLERANRYDKNFSDKFKSVTAYAQDVIDIDDSHAVTIGFSVEDHNKYGSKISPKLYWNMSVNPQWTVKAGYAEGRITPAIREGSDNYLISAGPTRTYQGNDQLNPEQSKMVELSAAYVGTSFSGSATLFNSDISDLISTVSETTAGHTLVRYQNVKKANIRGLEGTLGWQLNRDRKLAFNYTYLQGEQRSGANSGKTLSYKPKHTANLKLSQYLNGIDANLSVAVKSVSSQLNSSFTPSEIRGHTTLNLGVVKSIGKSLEIRGSINNATDQQVQDGSEALYVGREFRLSLTGRF